MSVVIRQGRRSTGYKVQIVFGKLLGNWFNYIEAIFFFILEQVKAISVTNKPVRQTNK